jgi:trimeric autotransporter adhesin
MKNKLIRPLFCLLAIAFCLPAFAQGTAFTYQGRLNAGGNAANGLYDLQFTVFDSTNLPGTVVAGPLTNSATSVSNGLFTVTLNFGTGVFNGADRWLQIAARSNGVAAFTTLTPRQALTPSPYAIFAGGASAAGLTGTIPGASLGGTYSNPLTFNNGANSFSGTFYGQFLGLSFIGGSFSGAFIGDGSGLINLNASQLSSGTVPDARLAGNIMRSNQVWTVNGNAGTVGDVNFVGTTDFQPLEFRVANTRVMRFEPAPEVPNVLGGSVSNSIAPGVRGATIAGGGLPLYPSSIGGDFAAIGGGTFHVVNGAWGTIAGGRDNREFSESATVGGGYANIIYSNASYATISGGALNSIGGTNQSSWFATIGGGFQNVIRSNGAYSVIAGGADITVESGWSTVGGGQFNSIGSGALHMTIGGGQLNSISNFSDAATIGGGRFNVASGPETTVAGGALNNAMAFSAATGGGGGNRVESVWSVIAGGRDNLIRSNSSYITIAGGYFNQANTNSTASTIGGGTQNEVSHSYATIAGGFNNTANYDRAFIGGGANNVISPTGDSAFIGGGSGNFIANGSAAIVGGRENLNNGAFAFVGGGNGNSINGSGIYGAIPGGQSNLVNGASALAAGRQAQALHAGTFVWADSTGGPFASTANNQFLVRANGGVAINTNDPSGFALNVNGVIAANGFTGMGLGLTNINPAALVSGTVGLQINFANAANTFNGSYLGNGGGLTNVNAASLGGVPAGGFWQLGGNNVSGGQFLGSTNGQPLELRVANFRAMRFEKDGSTAGVHVLGGSRSNGIPPIVSGIFAATIGGGGSDTSPNLVSDDFATIAGGVGNIAGNTNASFDVAAPTVGGGDRNTASGPYSTVPGGFQNLASASFSFAAGSFAQATNSGAFVWSDGNGAIMNSTNNNSVTMRASGGYRLYSNAGASIGAYLAPGSGGWVAISDRNAKENLRPVDTREVLERVAAMPIQTWNYKAQDSSIRHLGAMAQDFRAAFGLGETENGINTVDADGVALAAIQGLNERLTAELKRRDTENAELKRELGELRSLVKNISRQLDRPQE